MQRREFINVSTALLGLPFLPLNPATLFGSAFQANEDRHTFKIGNIQCTLFRDLMFNYTAKDYFINAHPEELLQSLNTYRIDPNTIPSPFVALLLQTDDRNILIDTGIGFMEKPVMFKGNAYQFEGRLTQLLQQANIKNEAITDVIITHCHPDHIGGVFQEEQLNFPQARFHLHEEEWRYWHSSQSDKQPALFRYFIDTQITRLKGQNLHLFKGDFVELLPGVTAVKAHGHTPGQIALAIHSGKDHLLYISDAFLHPLHMEHLGWRTNYDWAHEEAKQSRIKLLELAHKQDMLIQAFHFDFPGLGRIEKKGSNWAWQYMAK